VSLPAQQAQPPQPSFADFVSERVNSRKWCVAKQRRGRVMQKYEVVILEKEFAALEQEFQALYGRLR
jgi:hypothetical protein